jgi:hypothetical protein
MNSVGNTPFLNLDNEIRLSPYFDPLVFAGSPPPPRIDTPQTSSTLSPLQNCIPAIIPEPPPQPVPAVFPSRRSSKRYAIVQPAQGPFCLAVEDLLKGLEVWCKSAPKYDHYDQLGKIIGVCNGSLQVKFNEPKTSYSNKPKKTREDLSYYEVKPSIAKARLVLLSCNFRHFGNLKKVLGETTSLEKYYAVGWFKKKEGSSYTYRILGTEEEIVVGNANVPISHMIPVAKKTLNCLSNWQLTFKLKCFTGKGQTSKEVTIYIYSLWKEPLPCMEAPELSFSEEAMTLLQSPLSMIQNSAMFP